MNFDEWQARWNLPQQAIAELRGIYLHEHVKPPPGRHNDSEEAVASRTILAGSRQGVILMRNNSGAFQTEAGRWVRFGLGNVSKAFNENKKSSDYIGFYPMYILPHHVGRTLAIFCAVETKHSGWVYKGSPDEIAQAGFLDVVTANGGIGTFVSCSEHLIHALEGFNHVGKINK